MSKVTCTRLISFDCAHRVMNHESKCYNLHGHRYTAEITAEAPELDHLGRVIDFSVIKERIGTWIDENWDHTTVLFEKDLEAIHAVETIQKGKCIFKLPHNPTVENMALYLLNVVCPAELNSNHVKVVKIKLWETPNCYAEVYLDTM